MQNVGSTKEQMVPVDGLKSFDKTLAAPLDLKTDLPKDAITDEEADAAATSLGLQTFSAEKSRKLKKIGLFTAQQGVIHLGVGRLAVADEVLQKLIQTAADIAVDTHNEGKDRVGALQAANSLINTLQKSIAMTAEFQSERQIPGPQSSKRRIFVDDSPVVPIQANEGSNVTVNLVDGSLK